jgi:hypothetical protein
MMEKLIVRESMSWMCVRSGNGELMNLRKTEEYVPLHCKITTFMLIMSMAVPTLFLSSVYTFSTIPLQPVILDIRLYSVTTSKTHNSNS